jgi:nicotinate-nucleotide pyrophosphorylase (carboxylating)
MNDELRDLVARALAEDLGDGDLTSEAVIERDARARAAITQKQGGVLFGFEVAEETFRQTGVERFEALVVEGEWREEVPSEVAVVDGPARALLTAERTALNLLCHLSGVATATAAWVDAVAGTGTRIRDTRKTLPGLRLLEKYAVRCGGGVNHRLGLGDAVLIKDNHVAAAGSVGAALAAARAHAPGLPCEVEVDTLEQLDEVLALGAELVLLDNFDVDRTREAVRRRGAGATRLESSGGLALANARAYAETGVDYLAVGALTHSVRVLDLGLDLLPS